MVGWVDKEGGRSIPLMYRSGNGEQPLDTRRIVSAYSTCRQPAS